MKRYVPIGAFIAGLVILLAVLPQLNHSQPQEVRLTRAQARAIADREAVKIGIPVDKSWAVESWLGSTLLDKELDRDPARRRAAANDPAIGPRLIGGYRVQYYRRGLEKNIPYGYIYIGGRGGEVLAVRRRMRNETPGAQLTEAQLRPAADAFVASHTFPGAPSPKFESSRPNVFRSRTDWVFRYRAASTFPTGNVVPYLYITYTGDKLAGWELIEEYADGSQFRSDNGSDVAGALVQFGLMIAMLFILVIMFLRKYHAGEVGIGMSAVLFTAMVVIAFTSEAITSASTSEGTGFGSGLDAQQTAWAFMGFKFLFFDLVMAVVVFLAWSVGESFARERWGERLASFDSLLRRDPFNATVGRSLLRGVFAAPAVAAAAFLVALVPISLGLAHPSIGGGTETILAMGGPFASVLGAAYDAIVFPVVAILFMLAFSHSRRALPVGIIAAVAFAAFSGMADLPIAPYISRVSFSFGAIGVAIAVFLAYDLLSASVATFLGSLLIATTPLLSVAAGSLRAQIAIAIAVPFVLISGYGIAALLTRREIVYSYEDLAPHVKRIVERERVKAEIDAANRIQAALLPLDAPKVAGVSLSSHYRAATEIGGDYFDFLPQATGEIGIAFGDVSGHGLTSGIVMSMAKAALLVQVDYDSSPHAVLNVLNDIVMKTAPKRILMTFFFGVLDPRTQTLRFASAGHLDPYVYRSATRKLEALSSWGFPLGVRRRDPFREHVVEFTAGDRLILYSDGLIEAVDDDGEPFGFERFERTLLEHGEGTADEIKKALLQSVKKFTRNRPPEDDQTLVVVSFEEVTSALRPVAVEAYGEHVN